ncbi:uncharacterized protein V1513DRAFT_465847 [Lipomyces chichibuensis]|uniref:uncharacterized protein n=1 Tax=Lipomyces chichibuensis TaxID=1546026 RepID=UPI00334389AF
MSFDESSAAQSALARDSHGTTSTSDDSSASSIISTSTRTQTGASDAMSTTSGTSSHSGISASKLNLSVLCPTCSTAIALDLPFLALADGYETSRPASTHAGDSDDGSGCSSSEYDSRDGESDTEMENSEDCEELSRMRRRTRRARHRHHARKVLVKELEQKVEQLTKQAATAVGRASNLQGQLDRVKRKSSMLRLSSQGQGSPLSTPAPPKVSQTVSLPVITTPMRAVSASVAEPILSKSCSTSSLKQLKQQELQQTEQLSPSQSQPSILNLFSLARTVSYFPFSTAIMASSLLPTGYTGLNSAGATPTQSSSSLPSIGGSPNIISSSSSSTLSTFSSRTTSTSTTSLTSLAMSSSPSTSTEQIISHLQLSIQKEKQLREVAEQKFKQVSQEIEDLSQSLFEQANEMVAAERRERAKAEEKMRDVKAREGKLLERLSTLEDAFSRIVRLRKELDDETTADASGGMRSLALEERRKSVALNIEEVAAQVVMARTKE